ncbi:MAG TPA: hypothetical protein VIH18_06770 [Candidatus Binatia bacterium]
MNRSLAILLHFTQAMGKPDRHVECIGNSVNEGYHATTLQFRDVLLKYRPVLGGDTFLPKLRAPNHGVTIQAK